MIILSDHAEKRRGQRGLTDLEIELVIRSPIWEKKRDDGRKEVYGIARNRHIKVLYEEKESYLRIVKVI